MQLKAKSSVFCVIMLYACVASWWHHYLSCGAKSGVELFCFEHSFRQGILEHISLFIGPDIEEKILR